MESLKVEDINDSRRLDIVLSSHKKVSSRSEAQRIIQSGNITVNHSREKTSPKRKVRQGDLIEFCLPPPQPCDLVPVQHSLDILHEDDHLIILNKPVGMVVHPSAGHYSDTLVNYLLYRTKLSNNDPIRPGIVHRIDKDTSGVMVIAKSIKAHEHLSKQFFDHSVHRVYEAVVWGTPDQPEGTIDKPLGRHPVDRKKFAVKEGGKSAVTHWKIKQKYKYLSLIECRLETGRTHQIRIHMCSIGHPLLGDKVYGKYRNYEKKLPNELIDLLKNYDGQALHAKTLGFVHPESNEWFFFESKRPEKMQRVLEALNDETHR